MDGKFLNFEIEEVTIEREDKIGNFLNSITKELTITKCNFFKWKQRKLPQTMVSSLIWKQKNLPNLFQNTMKEVTTETGNFLPSQTKGNYHHNLQVPQIENRGTYHYKFFPSHTKATYHWQW